MVFVKKSTWLRAGLVVFAASGGFVVSFGQSTVGHSVAARSADLNALRTKATDVTKKLGDLAKSGKVPTSDEGIALLKKLVEELDDIHQQLEQQQAEIDALKKGQEGPSNKELGSAVAVLKKVTPTGFEQFEYRRSTEPGKEQSAFYAKRTRLGVIAKINDNWTFKGTVDFATNSNSSSVTDSNGDKVPLPANGIGSITKDAYFQYKGAPKGMPATEVTIGQFSLPIGYEISRSDFAREQPERSIYNRTLLNGERSRGFNVKLNLTPSITVNGGLVDSLTDEDPEAINIGPGPQGKMAGIAGIHYTKDRFSVGLSGIEGQRPLNVTNGAAGVLRELGYVDAYLKAPFGPKTELRAEAMVGKDRVPGSNVSVNSNMSGYHVQLGYLIDPRNRLDVRLEGMNQNNNVSGKGITAVGASYNYYLSKDMKLTISNSSWVNSTYANSKYNITTLRLQYAF